MGERVRLAIIVTLVLLGILCAAGLMVSSLIPHSQWWRALVIGCPVLYVASVALSVILVRRWGAERDDFWWPDGQQSDPGR